MDDLRTLGLQDAAHDIDGGVMPVEKSGSRNQPNFMFRGIAHNHKDITN
jgi:hypothetical protein